LISPANTGGRDGERMKNRRWVNDPDFLLNLFQIEELVY
jgi:hypothetical protein